MCGHDVADTRAGWIGVDGVRCGCSDVRRKSYVRSKKTAHPLIFRHSCIDMPHSRHKHTMAFRLSGDKTQKRLPSIGYQALARYPASRPRDENNTTVS